MCQHVAAHSVTCCRCRWISALWLVWLVSCSAASCGEEIRHFNSFTASLQTCLVLLSLDAAKTNTDRFLTHRFERLLDLSTFQFVTDIKHQITDEYDDRKPADNRQTTDRSEAERSEHQTPLQRGALRTCWELKVTSTVTQQVWNSSYSSLHTGRKFRRVFNQRKSRVVSLKH